MAAAKSFASREEKCFCRTERRRCMCRTERRRCMCRTERRRCLYRTERRRCLCRTERRSVFAGQIWNNYHCNFYFSVNIITCNYLHLKIQNFETLQHIYYRSDRTASSREWSLQRQTTSEMYGSRLTTQKFLSHLAAVRECLYLLLWFVIVPQSTSCLDCGTEDSQTQLARYLYQIR